MVYDATRRRVVLFGGGERGSPPATDLSDVWEWDGSSWSRRAGTMPQARFASRMVHDPVRDKVVLFGGTTGLSNYFLADTWLWDGSSWTRGPAGGPPTRSYQGMAYDEARQQVVMFGGLYGSFTSAHRGDTWTWDGATWTQRNPASAPGA